MDPSYQSLLAVLLLLAGAEASESCSKSAPGTLTVHLVCHTHDDVGWLKTVDQYFYGANNTIQRAGVQYILDTVVEELQKDPTRRFSYVESAFLWRWWLQQDQQTKEKVKSLVASGRLELLNGGWSMNDEAAAHYTAIIDQMTLGLTFLNDTFGAASRPRVAWQIDPFGHSNEQASLVAQMGYDGLFFGRLDFADKDKRWKERDMEMVWQPSPSLGEAAWLFTGALPNGYGPPSGFCFDDTCDDQPFMDDPTLHDYNVDQKVDDFLKAVDDQAKAYRANHIIMTMGSDFQYQNARTWFKNIDKLIKYVNARQAQGSKVNVTYSTPSCYLDSLHRDDLTWNTKQDDFFPYASDHHAYWTGYFSSRPALKGFIRKTNAFLQALKQASAMRLEGRFPYIDSLSRAMGVAQHHDAVTGTAKQHVTDDYVLRLDKAQQMGEEHMTAALRKLGHLGKSLPEGTSSFCPFSNISACSFTETKETFQVVVYNSIARPASQHIRIPVPANTAYKVTDNKGNAVAVQLVPIPESVLSISYRSSSASQELVFIADGVPALGASTFSVSRTASQPTLQLQQSTRRELQPGVDTVVQQGPLSVTLDGRTGLLKGMAIHTSEGVKALKVVAEMLWYPAMAGNNSEEDWRASGAYIFRPNGTNPVSMMRPVNKVFEGPVVHELQQQFGPWASQVVRLYKGSFHVEVEWLVGPIPIEDGIGKEVITRYTVEGATTDNTFYTDANGREMQKRVKDHRPTWTLNVTEPVSGNYYPVTSRIIVNSTNGAGSFAVLNDRSQGGSSLSDGSVELMVHRRLLYDDAFGVGEALNETAFGEGLIVRGTHLLVHSEFASPDCDFSCHHRTLGEWLLMRPVVLFNEAGRQGEGREASPLDPLSGLTSPLPLQVHLLTLEPWSGDNQLLLRLEHMFASSESPQYSVPVTVNLENMFSAFKIVSARETVLSANQWLSDSQRLQWKVNTTSSAGHDSDSGSERNNVGRVDYPNGDDLSNRRLNYDGSNTGPRPVDAAAESDYSYGDADENSVMYGFYGADAAYDDSFEDKTGWRRVPNPRFHRDSSGVQNLELSVTLQPMQIRTFVVTVESAASASV